VGQDVRRLPGRTLLIHEKTNIRRNRNA
jgi:hypothetical protein